LTAQHHHGAQVLDRCCKPQLGDQFSATGQRFDTQPATEGERDDQCGRRYRYCD
jgi:hypothetical protein